MDKTKRKRNTIPVNGLAKVTPALVIALAIGLNGPVFSQEEIIAGSGSEVEDQENTAQFSSAEGSQEIKAGADEKKSKASEAKTVSISGYVDFGFFFSGNNGAGFVKDLNGVGGFGNRAGVFLGDWMSTAVNTRGESADMGSTRSFMPDPVQSGGRPTFMMNEVYLKFISDIHTNVRVSAAINVLPRTTVLEGGAGDAAELDTAEIDFKLLSSTSNDITFTAGKFIGITGIEYRWRKSGDAGRWGVTPSLLGRYTNGTPVGIKLRGKHFSDRLIYNVGLTNGSNFIDSTRLNDDVDSNNGKTVSGRLSYDFRIWKITQLELGASAEQGVQSGQADEDVSQTVWGPDLQMEVGPFIVRGQFFDLDVAGGGDFDAKRYTGQAFYVELFYGISNIFGLNTLGFYGRYGRRDVDEVDTKYVFVVDVSRITPGIHIAFTDKVILKAEYLMNFEHGVVPSIDNDVFTTSLVAKF